MISIGLTHFIMPRAVKSHFFYDTSCPEACMAFSKQIFFAFGGLMAQPHICTKNKLFKVL